MDQNELKYWVAFSNIDKIGPIRFKRILDRFETMGNAWRATMQDIIYAKIEPAIAQEIIINRNKISPDEELEKIKNEGIGLLTIKDHNYPLLLKEIYNPPPLLYYKGNLDNLNPAIAIVGTRKISNYGRQVTPSIVKPLAKNSLIIISGLAYGVDSLAHQSTIEVNGRTVAILGSGLDRKSIYPSPNRHLADKIIENNGAVISEYPIGTLPFKGNFPSRNRIIAGLSLGIVVIEGTDDSGSLITAQLALEQNRDIFAVPGNIFNESSRGPNKLLKMGAKPVLSAQDILDELDFRQIPGYNKNHIALPKNEQEKLILEKLNGEPLHIDKITQATGLSHSIVSSTLALMEMNGLVKNLGGMNYIALQ